MNSFLSPLTALAMTLQPLFYNALKQNNPLAFNTSAIMKICV
jgi:hypothetical protein